MEGSYFGIPDKDVIGIAVVIVIALYIAYLQFGNSKYAKGMREKFQQRAEQERDIIAGKGK